MVVHHLLGHQCRTVELEAVMMVPLHCHQEIRRENLEIALQKNGSCDYEFSGTDVGWDAPLEEEYPHPRR